MNVQGKIGFIGGGRMAEALIKGMIQAQIIAADQIMAADPDADRRRVLKDSYGITVRERANDVWDCETIVLAVKPQIVGPVLEDCRAGATADHLLISIAAGIPLKYLEGKLAGSGCRVIRVMPNTPALVMTGASAFSPGSRATAADQRLAKLILDAVGVSIMMEEQYLDAVTGLSGSGPAYVFTFIEALVDAGIKVGLNRTTAETLVLQTVLGAVKLAAVNNDHPAVLRAMVTSPGGTTIAGLHEMERAGFRGILMDAVEAATKRSCELRDLIS